MIRIELPAHLRTLARVNGDVQVDDTPDPNAGAESSSDQPVDEDGGDEG